MILLQFSENLRYFYEKWCNGPEKSEKSGIVQRKKCRARKTLKNATLDAKIGVDTAENEPRKGSEILKNRKKSRPIHRGSDNTLQDSFSSF